MHSTPVSMANPKLLNNSLIASASPISVCVTPGGKLAKPGKAMAAVCTAPSGCWFNSISKLTLRWRS